MPNKSFTRAANGSLLQLLRFSCYMATNIAPDFVSKNKTLLPAKEKSIAVLPFENISNDTLQQYFSDGITEDIITQLSKIADLKSYYPVLLLCSTGYQKNIKEIANELGVSAILEGSVRKEADKVRITAQLN